MDEPPQKEQIGESLKSTVLHDVLAVVESQSFEDAMEAAEVVEDGFPQTDGLIPTCAEVANGEFVE